MIDEFKICVKTIVILLFLTFFQTIATANASKDIYLTGTTNNLSVIDVTKAYVQSPKDSVITWHVRNSPGGSLVIGNSIAKLMRSSDKKTVFVIEGYCHSMCALLATEADKVVVSDNVPFVFHAVQMRMFGVHWVDNKSYVFRAYLRFWGKNIRRILTEQEYREFLAGKDVIVYGSRIKRVLNVHV